MSERKVALYLRLSVDDKVTKSTSLDSQEKILRDKLKELPEYAGNEILVFQDNGYSGTNLERPAVSELLERVENHEIVCILMKDTSRFGRDMLKVSYLFESVFPLFYTRVISVTDFYDSNNYKETTGGIDLNLRYMVAECYSRDLSKKAKAAYESRIKRGELVYENTMYGYKLNENRKMIINEDVAENVRLMFQMASEGCNTLKIRQALFDKKIVPPSTYRAITKYQEKGISFESTPERFMWSGTVVLSILRDERYTGTYVGGKRKNCELGKNKQIWVPKNEWVRIPNHHPAIIEESIFQKVQKTLITRTSKKVVKHDYLFKGQVFCGMCHRALFLQVNKTKPNYKCKNGFGTEDIGCSKINMLGEDLVDIVFAYLKSQAETFLETTEANTEIKVAIDFPQDAVQTEMARLKSLRKSYYEKMLLKEISKEDFIKLKADVDIELKEYNSYSLQVEAKGTKEKEIQENTDSKRSLAVEILNAQELTIELAKKVVTKLEIFQDEKINIVSIFGNETDI